MSIPYGSSPVYDEKSLPEALRKEHRTKSGTWGLLRVLEGEVVLRFTNPVSSKSVTPDNPAPIPPEAPHFVEVPDKVKLVVEFHRQYPLPESNTAPSGAEKI